MKFEVVLQNKHKINSKGEASIYLRITKDRKVKYLATGEYCKPSDWNNNKKEVKASNKFYKAINQNIQNFKTSIENIYNNTLTTEIKNRLSIDDFLEMLKPKKTKIISTDFFELINTKIETLKDTGKIGSSKYYHDCLNSIKKFHKKSKMDLTEITLEWLKNYETYLRKAGCIDGGIAVKMRAIRSIYNDAIKANLATYEKYPFKLYQISRLKSNKKIRSIGKSEIKLIQNLDVSNDKKLQLAKDLFLFSYYTGGINFIDMMKLQTSNIYDNGNRIDYTRSKTKGLFNLKLLTPAKDIIDKYKANAKITGFVFPLILRQGLTPLQISNRKHKTLGEFNRNLKTIGLMCNIDFDLTSYVARHSMAQHLKLNKVATDVISEAMGHQNLNITQTYLNRFGNDVTDSALETLL